MIGKTIATIPAGVGFMITKALPLIPVPKQRVFKLTDAARFLEISPKELVKHTVENRITAYDLCNRRTYKLEDLQRLKQSPPAEPPPPSPFSVHHGTNTAGVYFLKSSATGLVKIGRSQHIHSRIGTLNSGSPEPLVLLATWPTPQPKRAEKALHYFFERQHVRLEWFRITEDEIAFALKHLVETGEL